VDYLSEDAIDLRTSLRRFLDAQVGPHAAEWDSANTFPRDVFQQLANLGVMGVTVPAEYGGTGRDIPTAMMVIEELSKRSMALAIPYIMATCYAGLNLVECGSEEQKAALLPRVAAGELLFAYGLTEPDVGADLASVATTGRISGDEVIINGSKRFCSGAGISDYIYTLIKSDPSSPRYKNLSMVLIPTSTDGVTIEGIKALGLKGAGTADVTLEDVCVPLTNVMGGESGWNDGWGQIAGVGLDVERLEVAAMALGVAEGAFEETVAYTEQRQQFGKPIGTYQAVRHSLADLRSSLYAARLMTYDSAMKAQRHEPCGLETSMAKLFVTEAAKKVVLDCQSLMGAYGYVEGFACERFVRDVLAMPIIGGSSAIQRNNISKWGSVARTGRR
jgi:alkylation response protein AidB-like acyl-CoA dehydrogenase